VAAAGGRGGGSSSPSSSSGPHLVAHAAGLGSGRAVEDDGLAGRIEGLVGNVLVLRVEEGHVDGGGARRLATLEDHGGQAGGLALGLGLDLVLMEGGRRW
jgi:hypothetical protein